MSYAGIFLAAVVMTGTALASVPAAPAVQLMERIAGVYKHRFMSAAVVPGEADAPYQAEDIVEIVPYDREYLYLRVHLDFYNGHTCNIYGMARFEQGAFVYRDPQPPLEGEPPCVLKVGVEDGKLTLTDRPSADAAGTCAYHCGARGSLDYEIGLDKRRTIRYLERLQQSRQYQGAIDELRARAGSAAS